VYATDAAMPCGVSDPTEALSPTVECRNAIYNRRGVDIHRPSTVSTATHSSFAL